MAEEKKPRRARRKKKDEEAAEPQEVEATEEPETDASAEPQTDAEETAEPKAEEGDEPAAEAEADADEPSADAADEEGPEPETGAAAEEEAEEEPDAEAGEAAEEKPKRGRRRGAVETTTPKKKDEPTRPAPRDASGAVAVRAQAKYVRRAPRKARLVMDHIRGKDVSQARAILRHTPRGAAEDILKLLESAVANAENNFELDPEELRIGRAVVDEGPTIKRYRPRALGRATPIHKRTSHMTITLTTTGDER